MGRRGKVGRVKEKYKVNGNIRAPEVRVIAEDGKMLGVFRASEALAMAEDQGFDLIEIAPNANPPTCRIMDYGKWKYENKKKAATSRKKQTIVTIKEIQLRPRTDDHDIDVKLKHARRFLLGGDKVKINLRFLGREMAHKNLGHDLLIKVTKKLEDIAIVEAPPKSEGRHLFVLLSPDPKKIKEQAKSSGDETEVKDSAEESQETTT